LLPEPFSCPRGKPPGGNILSEGSVEVLRGDAQVAVVGEPGAILWRNVRAPQPASYRHRPGHIAGRRFCARARRKLLKSHPEIAFFLGKLLAERLNAATTYLVDLKRQLEGQGNHFGMVGEILETLIHHQHEEFMPGPEGEADPRL
jgi:hypothetical protein